MRIAIVGSGVSGLVAAWLLRHDHEVVLFEAADRPGGHTNTVTVDLDDASYEIDTGFIVCNDRTYPNFLRLLTELDVPTQPSEMSFSMVDDRTGLEYAGNNLNGLFAQRSNITSRSFWRMLRDIRRFGKTGQDLLHQPDPGIQTLADLLATEQYSDEFVEQYLIPLCSAIWSADPTTFADFPFTTLARFLDNHGLLDLRQRPQWMTVQGGARTYVQRIVSTLGDRVRLSSPVTGIRRSADKVEIDSHAGTEVFDHVVIATHSDQALRMLEDASDTEHELLAAVPYQPNRAVLHTDRSVLPDSPRAWAAWNYHRGTEGENGVAVTYLMNRLQRLDASKQICVTLNRENEIDPAEVIATFDYDHPVYTLDADRAQARKHEISGTGRTSFCGAYWRYGFHEDGVLSAVEACRDLGVTWPT